MTDAINPDALIDTLAALRAWYADVRLLAPSHLPRTVVALRSATDRLFAPPARDPREQAVLDAAKAWSRNYWRRDYLSDYGPEAKLAAAVDALLLHEEPDTTGPKCDMKGCNERGAGVAGCVFPNGNHYYACRAHRNVP